MKSNTKTFLALCTGPLLAVAVSAMTSSSESAMEIEGAEYLGCFHDNQEDRVLGDKFEDREMTPEVCREYCTGLGAALMAVQYGFECWCSPDGGLDYNRHYAVVGDDAVCDTPCSGDKDKTCGGYDSFNLYKLPAEGTPPPVAYVEPTPAPAEDPTPVPVEDLTPAPVEELTPAPVVAEEPVKPIEPSTDVDEIVPDWYVPDFIFDFDSCEENAWMCCWTASTGMELKDNTDVCRAGDVEYPGDSEGDVHCHGFAWADYNSDLHIRGLAEFVKNFNHEGLREYYGNIPDAPTCGCVESMPEVSKSDCNTYNEDRESKSNRFRPCDSNDLRQRYELLNPDGQLANLVGKCDNA